MIKLIREGSTKHPWLLKIIMLVIAVTFTIGMGWFGYETSQQPNVVATVGAYQVELGEFREAFNRIEAFYRNQPEQEVPDRKVLKQNVMTSLVERKLWLVAADDLNLDVHPDELRDSILKRQEFQKDGVFDPGVYHRLLELNRISPAKFEEGLMKDLRRQKVQLLVQDVATLNPVDEELVKELAAGQTAGLEDQQEIEKINARIRLQLLIQKKQQALEAFQQALRASSAVEIRQEFL
ncbi:MAG: SurA N-terminal domain-containing protein [Nitrospira sp.]|nr:SurA N-terminal domain-containing protein [Nitrospira sp.]